MGTIEEIEKSPGEKKPVSDGIEAGQTILGVGIILVTSGNQLMGKYGHCTGSGCGCKQDRYLDRWKPHKNARKKSRYSRKVCTSHSEASKRGMELK